MSDVMYFLYLRFVQQKQTDETHATSLKLDLEAVTWCTDDPDYMLAQMHT